LLARKAMDRTLAQLMASADDGDAGAADALFATLYRELHRLARRELSRRGRNITLGATTLLHEAYLDLSGRAGTAFPDRPRFMGYAARVMRGVIVDYVRRRRAQKRGGRFEITTYDTNVVEAVSGATEIEELAKALDELALLNARLAQVVDLKFFLWLLLRRDRGDAGRLRTDDSARLGEGADVPAPVAA
jgi:RNA polymerase sigma factor (TIGR02999 family)